MLDGSAEDAAGDVGSEPAVDATGVEEHTAAVRIRPVFGAGRIEARERAVMLSYEAEQRAMTARAIVAEQPLGVDEFTADALYGVEAGRSSIDSRIERLSRSWPLHRMPAIDRAILRQGMWELDERDEIPVAVIINEAVELAHDYSTDESGKFVNGVLSAAAREVRGHG